MEQKSFEGNQNQHKSREPMIVHEKIDIPDLHPIYKIAYDAAQESFKERINMSGFTHRKDLSKDIEKSQEKLDRIRGTILHGTEDERMAYVESDVFEHMLHKHITEADWFGDSTKSILPSVYDDLFNGVDLILEQSVGRGAYAFSTLAVDATFSAQGAIKKLEQGRENIVRGKLGRIKYFKSTSADITGRIDNIPHFVIGVGRPALFKLTSEYVQKGVQVGGGAEARQMVVTQIITQAKYFAQLLKRKNFSDAEDKYLRVAEEMSNLLPKEQIVPKEVDEVHKAILGYCANRERMQDR